MNQNKIIMLFIILISFLLIVFSIYINKSKKNQEKNQEYQWKWEDNWNGDMPSVSFFKSLNFQETNSELFAIQFYTDILSENYNDALKKSKELNKPILLIFVTNWCTYCNKMKLDTFSNEKVVKEIEEKYISVYVDADKEKDLVKKFSVTVLPSCVITNYKEEKLKVSVGFKKPEEFLKFIK